MKLKHLIRLAAIIAILPALVSAQYYETLKGHPNNREKNVHSGNQVRTTFFNYGLIGRENAAEDFGGEWPINSGHFYVGDISIMVGAEIELSDGQIITPVTVSDGPRGSNDVDPNDPTFFWGWEPLPGFNASDSGVAMSHQRGTWPTDWPDRRTDANDPGWPGQWNGFFGKDQFNADQESYWAMDDNRDKEFIRGFDFFPDANDTTRGGLALLANVRGLQWSQTLAQNTVFWLYDVTNIGTTNYDKAVFGMIVGTTIGGDGDTNDDNSRFNARENITYSWDNDNIGGTGWTPVAYLGYAFLESPGNSVNGFDDDNDGTDGSAVITEDLLLPRVIQTGEQVVTIDYDSPFFTRSVVDFPAEGITFTVNDETYSFQPGDTLYEQPYDNIDNNLNGLIDENTEIQDGIDNNNNGLVDEENPQIGLAYKDFIGGNSTNPLIDESRADGIDNDGDWNASIDDVGLDGQPGTNDFGEGDGLPTSGYQDDGTGNLVDTGLPGEPNIDKTDIDESDQIGLTSFYLFKPFNLIRLRNDDQLWETLLPGYFDDELQNDDVDFIYGTAYFPLQVNQTERISLAFFFGNNENEIFRTKNTVQLIYNNDYNFAKAPQLPKLRAAAGDNKVTLYWDSNSEQSYDRLSEVVTGDGNDFEGYKVYRATFPTWDETGVVTNVFGSRISDVPVAQFDIVNADSGFFPEVDPQTGAVFYLGDNTGLRHTYVDTTVKNGFNYFYAVTAYDRGINATDPTSGERRILQPSETSKFAAINTAGEIELGQNVVVVRPEAPVAGYVPPGDAMESLERVDGDASGSVSLEVIDPLEVKDGNTYQVGFTDKYIVRGASDTTFLRTTDGFYVYNVTTGDTVVPLNTNINVDATVFDGVKLRLRNDWITGPVPTEVTWTDTTRNILKPTPAGWSVLSLSVFQGVRYPASYQIEVGEAGIDTSSNFLVPNSFRKTPVNFRVKNTSENRYVEFNVLERGPDNNVNSEPDSLKGVLDGNDIVIFFEYNQLRDRYDPTYSVTMSLWDSTKVLPQAGDVLILPVNKPFLSYDRFEFTAEGPEEDKTLAKDDLDKIKVVPNPYIAAAAWEPRNTFSSGRGERAIHFIHLPKVCTIRIYNVRGELVDTIHHESTVTDGTADWDLLSRDQLDVAYGVYIYHVDAPGIGKKVGKFAVIK